MKSKEEIFSYAYWAVLAFLIVSLSFYAVSTLLPSRSVSFSLLSIVPIVLVSCVVIWIGDVTNNVTLKTNVSKMISVSFISVILACSAEAIAQQLGVKGVQVEACFLLNEKYILRDGENVPYLTKLEERSSNAFIPNAEGDIPFVIGCRVSGARIDGPNTIDLSSEILLVNDTKEIATVNYNQKRRTLGSWRNKRIVKGVGIDKVEDFFKPNETEEIFLSIVFDHNKELTRDKENLRLVFRVFDNANQRFTEYEKAIDVD